MGSSVLFGLSEFAHAIFVGSVGTLVATQQYSVGAKHVRMDGTRQGLPSCHVRNIEVRGMAPWDADKPAERTPGRLKVLHLLGPTRPNLQTGDGKAKQRLRSAFECLCSHKVRCGGVSSRLGVSRDKKKSLLVNGRNGSELTATQLL
ncbi:hypothetical protein BDP81DRAFT_417562 [Colletotrichum phormii]|uniref:Uncharacterized protein n=1 Tax=Colletotrichum phormii TaxID=359342 RepID=A0AAJ0EJB7_9PEZI|nr:uncharacterized protein BDP81DRAFT_417562 [Colletotrichum phormii]KAK1640869.1 hypothetical protein BDP81DRAFT_417562 [Colletotrichum phormii]